MSGGPVDADALAQLLPGLRGPCGAKQCGEESATPGGGPQLQSPGPQPATAQLQSPAPQLQSPLSQPQSLPQMQSPSPQLHSPSPQLKLQSPTQLQPAEVSTPRNANVKREPPGTPNRGTATDVKALPLKFAAVIVAVVLVVVVVLVLVVVVVIAIV